MKRERLVKNIKRANRTLGPVPPGRAHTTKKGEKGYRRKRDRTVLDERD